MARVRDVLSRPFEFLGQAYRPKISDEGAERDLLANAILIALCIEETATTSELLAPRRNGENWSAPEEWRFLALSSRASMSTSSWDAFASLLDVEHLTGDQPDLHIGLHLGISVRRAVANIRLPAPVPLKLDGNAAISTPAEYHPATEHQPAREGILCDSDTDLMIRPVEPLVEQFPEASLTFTAGADGVRHRSCISSWNCCSQVRGWDLAACGPALTAKSRR